MTVFWLSLQFSVFLLTSHSLSLFLFISFFFSLSLCYSLSHFLTFSFFSLTVLIPIITSTGSRRGSCVELNCDVTGGMYCIVLYCPVVYCTVLCCTVLSCTVLHCTVLYCTVLYCPVLYYVLSGIILLHCL